MVPPLTRGSPECGTDTGPHLAADQTRTLGFGDWVEEQEIQKKIKLVREWSTSSADFSERQCAWSELLAMAKDGTKRSLLIRLNARLAFENVFRIGTEAGRWSAVEAMRALGFGDWAEQQEVKLVWEWVVRSANDLERQCAAAAELLCMAKDATERSTISSPQHHQQHAARSTLHH